MTNWLRKMLRAWLLEPDESSPLEPRSESAPQPIILQLGYGVTVIEPTRELLEDAIRMRDDMARAGSRLVFEEWARWH